jgi:hypothetical protein
MPRAPAGCRVEVYDVPSGTEPWGRRVPLAHADVPDGAAVKGMAWVGPHLVVCTGLKYLLVAPGQQGGQVSNPRQGKGGRQREYSLTLGRASSGLWEAVWQKPGLVG